MPEQLIAHLESLGVRLHLEEGRLRVNAPKGSLTQELKETIAASKDTLVAALEARDVKAGTGIAHLGRTGPLPVSAFQERVWVLQRIDPENTSFNIAASWLLPRVGPLSVMTGILRTILERHDILRSTFSDTNGTLCAHPQPADTVPLVVEDLRALDLAALDPHVLAALEAAPRTPFDLTSSAPVRLTVFQLRDDHYAVVLCAHHIAVDEWSLSLLGRELIDACRPASTFNEPGLQFADFAAWQRISESSATAAADLDWWSDHLAGAPQLSLFPPDRPPSGTTTGAMRVSIWDAEFADRLRAAARQGGVTPYMVSLAALATVLRWHTGQDDVVFGSPMGMREHIEVEKTIGPFVNLLLIRIHLSDDPTFQTLLTRVRDAVLDAHAHRSVPFESVVERLKPPRTLDYSPLFQVAVIQHNATSEAGTLDAGTPGRIRSGGAMNEITLFLRDLSTREIQCTFEYRSNLYSEQTIDRITRLLTSVLAKAVAHPDTPLSELCTLQGGERERVARAFNPPPVPLNPTMFPAVFAQRAVQHPEALAISHEGRSLTYGELDRRSNQLARRLTSLGIGRGALVGVCVDRSLDLVVALLGVQKTGAAYVPLDPAFPDERLRFMLTDSGSSLVVTGQQDIELPAGVTRLDLIGESASIAAEDSGPLQYAAALPEDPVYLIYTSGSTGRPKGVAVPHRGLMNFLWSMALEPGMNAGDVLAAVTTVSFDIAGLELYLPLLVGARIELVSREAAADGHELAARLATCGATVMQATPATWRLLIEAGWAGVPGFRALCGGEALPHDLADALGSRVAELWNLYGPTETTIWSTVGRVERSRDGITIGRPIANTQIYMHGATGLVPIGLPGEICIGGAGVALGYHKRPELTSDRFIPNPYSDDPDAKLYRTGDFGRWRDDGQIEHLGRLDHQVKIRGFRIELGEIEAVLTQYSAIRQAVVHSHEAAPGDSRLVAYVVCNPGEDLTVSDVRRYLRGVLPDYMVPALIVAIDAVPLTSNGKVDRSALPDPFKSGLPGATYQAPAAGLEQTLAEIWSDVLKVDRVGAHDNFFELGGHSLLSLRVATAVEKRSGWRMDPRLLFFQTLSQIAAIGTASLGGAPRKHDTAVLRDG